LRIKVMAPWKVVAQTKTMPHEKTRFLDGWQREDFDEA